MTIRCASKNHIQGIHDSAHCSACLVAGFGLLPCTYFIVFCLCTLHFVNVVTIRAANRSACARANDSVKTTANLLRTLSACALSPSAYCQERCTVKSKQVFNPVHDLRTGLKLCQLRFKCATVPKARTRLWWARRLQLLLPTM